MRVGRERGTAVPKCGRLSISAREVPFHLGVGDPAIGAQGHKQDIRSPRRNHARIGLNDERDLV